MRICSLFSGSSGNAIFVCTENTKLLVEAGLSGKKIAEALSSIGESLSEISAVLVSHEHIDHVRGAGVLARRYNLPIYASTGTWEAMEQMIGPVSESNKKKFSTYVPFEIGDITITPFPIPHDANEPVGYSFSAAGKKATIATDIGHISMDLLRSFEDSDLLLLESNHDIEMLRMGPYPWPLKQRIAGKHGHLSNDAAGEVIAYMAERGTRKFLLGHLSKENNFPELAYQTVRSVLCEKCVNADSDISLDVALRDRVSRIIEI
ncbi:MAG: MBL fold metallo-hydrolase [Clostridiaceae bacterium]|jgi:phosphoribosyl 1,2-cyclic phosphodiesterase|nr:MBL fold metallo-hydrolase [Clostridiaceae bacterium]